MKKLPIFTFLFFTFIFSLFAGADESSNIYDSIISPVLEAKCVNCHGAEKDKGKLRMHTKESLLKGGRGAGDSIIVKGEVEESEIIFRITLPKNDEEAMPPMEDESHYNPVTPQELSVLKSWIKFGASFDMLIDDLDETGRKAAEHVLNNLPQKKLSATALLIPKLPSVPVADQNAVKELRNLGVLVMPIAQNTNALYVNASYVGKSFDDSSMKMLLPLTPQILWLNLARTSISDKSMPSLAKLELLERLHAENTSISDASTKEIAKLSNLRYLNLYGTKISDASIVNLRKLSRLEKVFLWQTKVTPAGAERLRENFVDRTTYANLVKQKGLLSTQLRELSSFHEKNLLSLENVLVDISLQSSDHDPINDKCPVSNKPVDDSHTSYFEGRKVGFCCEKCKSKFDRDQSSFRSKINNFKPSKKFSDASSKLKLSEENKDKEIEVLTSQLREVSLKISKMGPEINMGWSVAKTSE